MNTHTPTTRSTWLPKWLGCLVALATAHTVFAAPPSAGIDEVQFRQYADQLATLKQRHSELRQVVDQMQQATSSRAPATANADSKTNNDTDEAASSTAVAATRLELEQLRAAHAATLKNTPQLPDSLTLADLERRQRDTEAERDQLNKKLTEQLDGGGDQGPGLRASTFVTGKKTVEIVLTNGRMVPVREPYYSFDVGPGYNSVTREQLQVVKIKRVRDGSPVATAIKEGEMLDKMITENGLDPDSHIIFLAVCSDSVTSFHLLRQAIQKRGFAFAWTTFRDRTLIVPAGGGGGGNTKIEVF